MKIKLVNSIEAQKMAEKVTGFYNTKKVYGRASKSSTIQRLNCKSKPNYVVPKYVMIEGVPHKMKMGKLIPMVILK